MSSHLFTSTFMCIYFPLIHFAPPPRFLIDFKKRKLLICFCILWCICCCFSHLIGLLSVTQLSLLYKFTPFFIYFLFLPDEGPMVETLDYTIRIGRTPTFLFFDLYKFNNFLNKMDTMKTSTSECKVSKFRYVVPILLSKIVSDSQSVLSCKYCT